MDSKRILNGVRQFEGVKIMKIYKDRRRSTVNAYSFCPSTISNALQVIDVMPVAAVSTLSAC